MDKWIFLSTHDFVYEVLDRLRLETNNKIKNENTPSDLSECSDVSIVVKYKDAKDIIIEMIAENFIPYGIVLLDPFMSKYDDEYIIFVNNIDGKAYFWCMPFKENNIVPDSHYEYNKYGYFDVDSLTTFVFGDCSSKCLKSVHSDYVYEAEINPDYFEPEVHTITFEFSF